MNTKNEARLKCLRIKMYIYFVSYKVIENQDETVYSHGMNWTGSFTLLITKETDFNCAGITINSASFIFMAKSTLYIYKLHIRVFHRLTESDNNDKLASKA